jgi:ATP-binding cassette subfamily B protein
VTALIVFLLNVVYAGFPLLAGLVLRAFFNALSGPSVSQSRALLLAAVYLPASAGQGIWWLLAGALAEYHFAFVKYLLRMNLFRAFLRNAAPTRPLGSGELVGRFQDDVEEAVEPVFSITVGAGQLVSAVVAFVVLYRINPVLTAVTFATPLLAFVVFRLLGDLIRRSHRSAREAGASVQELLAAVLNHVQAVQAADAHAGVVRKVEELGDQRRRTAVASAFAGAVANASSTAAVGLTLGSVLLLIGLSFPGIGVGNLALFAGYNGVVGGIALWISGLLVSVRRTDVSVDRIGDMAGAREAPFAWPRPRRSLRKPYPAAPQSTEPAGDRLVSLTIRSRSAAPLHVPAGQLVVVVGRVGAGKTTLLEALAGIRELPGPAIFWNGRPIEHPREWLAPPRCCYVPQVPRLFSESLRENLLLGQTCSDTELEDALWRAVLVEDVAALESGLETPVGPRGAKLSGGQIQRAAAARAFLRKPELLLMDDLSSALDVATERTLWHRVRSATVRTTCIAVSHRGGVLEWADTVVLVEDGEIVDHGTPADMRRRYPALLASQPSRDE